MKKFTVRIAAIKQETPTVKSFVLEYGEQAFHHLPGQWIKLSVEIDGKMESSGYSMTSSPLKRGVFELAIKQGARNPVTRYMYETAKVGDNVTVSDGQGVFIFERGMGDKVVLIGAGVGVTPLMSLLRYIDEAAPEVDTTLLYSIPSPEEFLFRDELAEITSRNPHIHCIVTVTQQNPANWKGATGRIDKPMLQKAGLGADALYYLCGPQAMIEDVDKELSKLGIPASRIVYEKWW